jgi:hypothetical protein
MFGLEMTPAATFWLVVGCATTPFVVWLLFMAACALADVHDPSWAVSIMIAVAYSAALWLAAWGLFEWIRHLLPEAQLYQVIILSFLAAGTACWVVCSGVYALVLFVSLRKSFFTSSAQLLLEALIGCLAIGITLFVLSLRQIGSTPANKTGQGPAAPAVVVGQLAP